MLQTEETEPNSGRAKLTGFAGLPLSREVLRAVEMAGYDAPTAVQSEIIPLMQDGRDVLAQSQTGTGKTAAFALPILSRLDICRREPQTLVLTPTRELAIQVAKSFSSYGKALPGFSVAAIYGGQDYEAQFRQLKRGVHVVVGTPGRVIDHIKRGTLRLGGIDCLVLDEADEMLNMGFLEDVEFTLERTPEGRQIALFSATLPPPIRRLAQRYLNDPAKVTIEKKTMTADSIRQRVLFVAPRDKLDALTRILEVEETDGVIVFTRTREATVSVAEELTRRGLSAVALNGDMHQKARERTIERLRSGQLNVLVATDVAARGLDVSRVSHVFNFDAPHDAQSYIHRVGRTGRAGRNGEAIIFLTNAQRSKLQVIERATKQPIEVMEPPSAEEINTLRMKRFKERIANAPAGRELRMFEALISEYAEESGTPLETIAAVLAQLAQGDAPFFLQDRPRRSHREQSSEPKPRGGKRRLLPPRPGMVRYRVEVGREDGVKAGNIVGAVANEGGINGADIGPIEIHASHSTIDLPEGMPAETHSVLRKARVGGKKLCLTRAGEDADAPRPRRRIGPFKTKPRGTTRHEARSPKNGKSANGVRRKKRKGR